jgi:hypothetical protein
MTAFLAILGSIWGVVSKVLAAVPWQVWLCLGIFLAGGWVFSGGSCRDFMCHRTPRPPRPPRVHETVGSVLSVEDANHLTIQVSGPLGRRKWPVSVTIDDVVVSVGNASGMALTASLCPLDSIVKVKTETARIFGDEGKDVKCSACNGTGKTRAPKEWVKSHPSDTGDFTCWACGGSGSMTEYRLDKTTELEAARPLVGQVFASTGQDVGLELIKAGLATCGPDASDEYRIAEKQAKKHKGT